MLPEEDALPGTQGHAAVHYRDLLIRLREHHLDMARHIVGAFVCMGKVGIVGRNEAVEVAFEVDARSRVGIFHEDQARTGVLAKNGEHTGSDAAVTKQLFELIRYLERSRSTCSNL